MHRPPQGHSAAHGDKGDREDSGDPNHALHARENGARTPDGSWRPSSARHTGYRLHGVPKGHKDVSPRAPLQTQTCGPGPDSCPCEDSTVTAQCRGTLQREDSVGFSQLRATAPRLQASHTSECRVPPEATLCPGTTVSGPRSDSLS
ncbi:hypothetical protein H920_11674 [Fukomys damarensis]|uniref:Uncharacterized protein n=1 Tax=Fukomys damarensis TaxID=885580 RepID=A0A091D477_FUKDA|nr:hypothetical protein H920_11674 [Fukomys damarensis]